MPEGITLQPLTIPVVGNAASDAQTTERLHYHKAVLESLGVSDLSSLGKLAISGAVVPQPGLTIPTANVLGAEAVFQSARRVAPESADGGNGLTLEPAGGSARLLNVTPASLQRLAPAAIPGSLAGDAGLGELDLPSIHNLRSRPPTRPKRRCTTSSRSPRRTGRRPGSNSRTTRRWSSSSRYAT